jgi:hypothetical protein
MLKKIPVFKNDEEAERFVRAAIERAVAEATRKAG